MWAHEWETVNMCLNPLSAGVRAGGVDAFELEHCAKHLRSLPDDVIAKLMYLKKRTVLAAMGRTQKAEQIKWTKPWGTEHAVRSRPRRELRGPIVKLATRGETFKPQARTPGNACAPEPTPREKVLEESIHQPVVSSKVQVSFSSEASAAFMTESVPQIAPQPSPVSQTNDGEEAQLEEVPFKKYTPAVAQQSEAVETDPRDSDVRHHTARSPPGAASSLDASPADGVLHRDEDDFDQVDGSAVDDPKAQAHDDSDMHASKANQDEPTQSDGYMSGRSSDMEYRPPTTASIPKSPRGVSRRKDSADHDVIAECIGAEVDVMPASHEPSFDWMQVDGAECAPPKSAPEELAQQHRMMSGLHENLEVATNRFAQYSPLPQGPKQVGFDILKTTDSGNVAADGRQGASVGFKIFADPFGDLKLLHRGDVAKWSARHVDLRGQDAAASGLVTHRQCLPLQKDFRRESAEVICTNDARKLRAEMRRHARVHDVSSSSQIRRSESSHSVAPSAYIVSYDGSSPAPGLKTNRTPLSSVPNLTPALRSPSSDHATAGKQALYTPIRSRELGLEEIKNHTYTFNFPLLSNAGSASLHQSGAMTERSLREKSLGDSFPMLNRGIKGKNIVSEATKLHRGERQLQLIEQKLAKSRRDHLFALAGVPLGNPSQVSVQPNECEEKNEEDASVPAHKAREDRTEETIIKMGDFDTENDSFNRTKSQSKIDATPDEKSYAISTRAENLSSFNNSFKMQGIYIPTLERTAKNFGFAPHSPRELRSRSRPRRPDRHSSAASPIGTPGPCSPISSVASHLSSQLASVEAGMKPDADTKGGWESMMAVDSDAPASESKGSPDLPPNSSRQGAQAHTARASPPLQLSLGGSHERLVISIGNDVPAKNQASAAAPHPELREAPVTSFPDSAVSLHPLNFASLRAV